MRQRQDRDRRHPIRRLRFVRSDPTDRLTHYLFRYPAKFHPPVVRALIERYSDPGDTVLDPFCGSGTLLVEAAIRGRDSIGVDVDPVATFVSTVKTLRPSIGYLRGSAARLMHLIGDLERSVGEYEKRQSRDITQDSYRKAILRYDLYVPPIPNLFHWFRRYVIVDLARLQEAICNLGAPQTHRDFFLLCFASIIRASSNADPVPVSGLEVTAHMKRLEKRGRLVNPFHLFRRRMERSLSDMEQFHNRCDLPSSCQVIQADSTELSHHLRRRSVDVVISSPPYHNAVDYYRRHTLEMYWLGLVDSEGDRLLLRPQYVGLGRVRQSHPFVTEARIESRLGQKWERRLREQSAVQANAFKHYMVSMHRSMLEIAKLLRADARALFVLGKSTWNGEQIPTTRLFEELGTGLYVLEETLWYPLKNRYMSYSRHNGASIDKEYVLVFRRT
jgi:16S rRNA G966 N2-methylase RsmD